MIYIVISPPLKRWGHVGLPLSAQFVRSFCTCHSFLISFYFLFAHCLRQRSQTCMHYVAQWFWIIQIIHVYTRRGKSACTSGDAFSEVAILHNNQGHWSALTGTCSCIVLRSQKAIAAHFESEQILPIVFAWLYLIGHKTWAQPCLRCVHSTRLNCRKHFAWRHSIQRQGPIFQALAQP